MNFNLLSLFSDLKEKCLVLVLLLVMFHDLVHRKIPNKF